MFKNFVAHKCKGLKWRPYPVVVCNCCHYGQGSFNLAFTDRKEYEEYVKGAGISEG